MFIHLIVEDWLSIYGNPSKLGLGVFSIMFDILFICQHYVIYPERKRKKNGKKNDSTDDEDSPLLKDEISKSNATVQVRPKDTSGFKKIKCFV